MQPIKTSIPNLTERLQVENNRREETGAHLNLESKADQYECNQCQDERVIFDPVRNVAQQCSCVKQRRLEQMFKNSQISVPFRQLQFENYITVNKHPLIERGKACATTYVSKFGEIQRERRNSLALLGLPGVGKTHLICAIANSLISQGMPCLYFQHIEGFSDLRSNMNDLDQKVRTMKEVDVLVWDDLFKLKSGQEPTPFEFKVTFEVINYRYLNHKPIVISSERDRDELCAIDEAIGSRVIEMTRGFTVTYRLTEYEKANGISLNHRLM